MPDHVSLEGPIELINGDLVLHIPLAAGGDRFASSARGICKVDGENLNVIIKPWLAEKLKVGAGSLVIVDNHDGKFNITRSAKNDEPPSYSVA